MSSGTYEAAKNSQMYTHDPERCQVCLERGYSHDLARGKQLELPLEFDTEKAPSS